MCMICIEFNAGRMSKYDVRLALIEMGSVIPREHAAALFAATESSGEEE